MARILSLSGRAVVAYHSMLVFDVLGTSNFDRCEAPDEIPADSGTHQQQGHGTGGEAGQQHRLAIGQDVHRFYLHPGQAGRLQAARQYYIAKSSLTE